MTAGFIAYVTIMGLVSFIALLVWLAAGIAFLRAPARSQDRAGLAGFSIGGFVVLALVVVGSLFALYPYSGEYHSWRVHEGTVAQIASRLVASGEKGGGTDQKFVVTFKGSSQEYGVVDTRAALVKPGDHLQITCIRRHQWGAGVDGYDCRWDQ